PTVDNNGQRIQSEIPKASYKSTILRDSLEKSNGGFLEEEFTLLDGDAVTEVIEEFRRLRSLVELPGLPEGYYLDCLLRVIGQTVGPVVKLDVQTDCASRGRFVRLVICVDLRMPLVSKVQINVDVCPEIVTASPVEESGCTRLVMKKPGLEKKVEDEPYVNEGEIFAVFNGEINESDEVVTKDKSNGDGDIGLGLPKKNVIEAKGKQAKLRAEGKKVVMGNRPKSALKVLKPNNGSLGMNLNIRWGDFDDGSRLAQVGATDRGKAIVMKKWKFWLI
ncbi:hypothetical protein Golax_004623, partial [Gossypium laxum]|nr:hypothetical protein [Gossypium laxum]